MKKTTTPYAFAKTLLLAGLLTGGVSYSQCSANFTFSNGQNGSVQFVSTSANTNTNTLYNWDFGDGGTDINASTSHTYGAAGIYTVTLEIGDSLRQSPNPNGCYSTITKTVSVLNAPCLTNPSFSLGRDTTQLLTWSVYPVYPQLVTAVVWSWGDGSTSTGMYPSHTYSAAGVYNICVSVTVSCGSAATGSFCSSQNIYRTSQPNSMVTVNVVGNITGIAEAGETVPKALSLFPNPTDGGTYLKFNLPQSNTIVLSVYELSGRKVLCAEEKCEAGAHVIKVETGSLQEGIYLLNVNYGDGSQTLRLIKN
jgi:hypothetical protein